MAATVLSSDRAIEMSIFIVRAFAKLRKAVQDYSEISRKLDTLERQVSKHDKEIVSLVWVIKRMLSPKPVAKKRRIGFKVSR